MKTLIKSLIAYRILAGPFRGMRYTCFSKCSSLYPKILGSYEIEIEKDLIKKICRSKTTIIDVGCAEGYYAVGALYINPGIKVIGFDADESALQICKHLAEKNKVCDRLELQGGCDARSLERVLDKESVDLILMDVEGAEIELLNPIEAPGLSHVDIIVELHDMIHPGIKDMLAKRFWNSHKCIEVPAKTRSWDDIPVILPRKLARCFKELEKRMTWERPEGMSWLIMESNADHTSS